eukprot:2251480-Amphidinium_carterae.1
MIAHELGTLSLSFETHLCRIGTMRSARNQNLLGVVIWSEISNITQDNLQTTENQNNDMTKVCVWAIYSKDKIITGPSFRSRAFQDPKGLGSDLG